MILISALVTGSVEWVGCFTKPSPGFDSRETLECIVLGDWGRQGQFGQQVTANRMAEVAHTIGADFVISTGDNFYDNGVTSVDDSLWFASYENIYAHKSLQIPWYVALGNHDYRGNPQAQIEYSTRSRRWRMPSRYFHIDTTIGGASLRLVILDTNPFIHEYYTDKKYQSVSGQDTAAQWRWLENTLATATSDWTIVVGHHPVYSAGTKHGNTSELITRLEPLLQKYRVPIYLAGHEHDLQHLSHNQINYFISGAGSSLRPTGTSNESVFSLSQNGFLRLSIAKKSIRAAFIDVNGAIVHEVRISNPAH